MKTGELRNKLRGMGVADDEVDAALDSDDAQATRAIPSASNLYHAKFLVLGCI